MAAGIVRADDRVVGVPGVESLFLVANKGATVTYEGTEGDDWFVSSPSPASALMQGGDDELIVLGTDSPSDLDGGPGTDLLDFGAGADNLTADLVAGTASVIDGAVTETYTFADFENARAQVFDTVRLTGTDGPNVLQVFGCDIEVMAGAGDDVVRWREVDDMGLGCSDPGPVNRLYGEEGDDVLVSDDGNDTLIGGPGTDTADGNRGEDHCEAETVTDCES